VEVTGRAVLSGSESDCDITAALRTFSREWRVVYCADGVARRRFRACEDSHITGGVRRRLALFRRTDQSLETKREDDDGRSARPRASHFETFTHLMLRRSPSARGGVMSRRSQCVMDEEENQ
jgi:hypothetical protein